MWWYEDSYPKKHIFYLCITATTVVSKIKEAIKAQNFMY